MATEYATPASLVAEHGCTLQGVRSYVFLNEARFKWSPQHQKTWPVDEAVAFCADGQPAAAAAMSRKLDRYPYPQYLRTPEWRAKCAKARRRARNKCEQCARSGKEVKLHVHHMRYGPRGQEKQKELKVLCEDCHGKGHEAAGDGVWVGSFGFYMPKRAYEASL